MRTQCMIRGLSVLAIAAACSTSLCAGVVQYGFEDAQIGGQPALLVATTHVQSNATRFVGIDSTDKTEGVNSLHLKGISDGDQFGNYRNYVAVGLLGAGGVLDLSANGSQLTFKVKVDNDLNGLTPVAGAIFFDIYLYAGGTLDAPTQVAARFWRSDLDPAAGQGWATATQQIKKANGAYGDGFQSADSNPSLLNAVKFVRIQYGWSHSTFTNKNLLFEVRLDDLQLSSDNVTAAPVPEPAALGVVLTLPLLWARRSR